MESPGATSGRLLVDEKARHAAERVDGGSIPWPSVTSLVMEHKSGTDDMIPVRNYFLVIWGSSEVARRTSR